MTPRTKGKTVASPFQRVLPASVRVGQDKLKLRLDIYEETMVLRDCNKTGGGYRIVSPLDVASAISRDMSYASGILPPGTLWWSNSTSGSWVAIWIEPGVRRLSIRTGVDKPAERYDVPLPGLIFICQPGRSPWVYAASHRPAAPNDRVYKAPLANVYDTGSTCGGSNDFPDDIAAIPESFLISFFTRHLGTNLSRKYPGDITKMWKALHGKKQYPLSDLVYHGTVADIMQGVGR